MQFKDSMCKAQFSFQLVLVALLLTAAQSGFAQTPPASPLSFGNNFFVTGDYIVAGASGMTTKFTTINGVSYALGTITVPDSNPGITGVKQVPVGAEIVAALLYWQTVEKVGVAPGANGSGQNGYFRPLLYSKNGGPAAPGYAMSGTSVSGSNTVSWSSGGCGGGSTGKVLRTYRADVSGGLPNDANGNPTPNGSFEVRIPSAGNSAPLTLGATLVVIYRIPSGAGGPQIPLNSIVIYDGDYSQSNTQLTMTQKLQGFYDADHSAVSRLTHIVGSGQSNKFQNVYLSSGTNSFVKLPLLYGNKLPAFPGWYGNWDNPTWTFTNASKTIPGVLEDDSFATTQIMPSMSNQGCVSWGAVIMSTTVKNTDGDGILDSWKLANPSGYCDASLNNGVCRSGDSTDPGWVPLPGAMHGQKDVFLQYDYMCSTVSNGVCTTGGADYSFDPRLAVDPADGLTAVDKVVKSYANLNGSLSKHPEIVLHAIPGNAIVEKQPNILCGPSDTDPSGPPGNLTCPFPGELGAVGFRYGVENIKNYSIETQTGRIGECTLGTTNCAPVFQTAKKDSYHYALFADGVGVPNWFLFDKSLLSVAQKGNTVTFTTALPHGIKPITGDSVCSSNGYMGRVTVLSALTNPNLNGTFCIKNVNAAGTTFDITVPGSPTIANYPANAEPYLGVADARVTSMSGFSDVGGQNVVVALGYGGWGPANVSTSDGNKWQTKAGTLMHELGHNMGLTHGGTFYNNLPNNPNDYTATFEANCKPNVQTSMSYMFQFDLMQVPGVLAAGQPLMVVDYSEDDGSVPALTESSPQAAGVLTNLPYANTAAFQLPTNNSGAPHCDGSPLAVGEKSLTYTQFSPATDFFWSSATGFDINFDGKTNEVLHPHNEWTGTPAVSGVGMSPGIDLLQISAIGTLSTSGAGGGHLSGGGGGGHLSGGGGGGHLSGGGGGGHLSGGGGGGHLSGGGGSPSEFTHEVANSYARPPRTLIITQEEASPRHIDLSWFVPTFGTPANYNIYRTVVGTPFPTTPLTSVPGTQTTFTDTVTCNALGYQYRVTALTNNDAGVPQESVPTNTVPATGEPLLTGCYLVDPVNGLSNFTVPANGVQGNDVSISWTLVDDFFIINPNDVWAHAAQNGVSKLASGKLFLNGPVANGGNCTTTPPTGHTLLATITNGVAVAQEPGDTLNNNGDVYTFMWNHVNTDNFCSGPYTFELDLDSGQKVQSTNALQLGIDINDLDGPRITNAPLTAGTVGVSYSNTFTQDGGVGAITWSISQGSLPNGITLNSATGVISGYATTACTCTFTVQAKDSNGNIGTQAFSLVMHIWVSASPAPASAPPSFVANATLPPMTVGVSTPDSTYQSGAVGAVTWSLAQGSNPLPTGITINNGPNTTGVLSGYPTPACTCQFTIVATDSAGNIGTLTFTLVVHIFVSASQPPAAIPGNFPFVPNPTLPAMTVGVQSQDTVYQSGAIGAVTWAFTGSLPPGVSQQGTGATISGTTCAAVSYNLGANVTDSANNTGSQVLTLQVNKGTTTTGVTSNPNPSAFQQPVTFTVTVASQPQSSCVPTGGTVTVMDGANPIAVNLALSGGVATFTTTALSVGSHSITASYSGDPNFTSSNSGVWSQNVSQANTQVAFNSLLPATQFVGQPITVSYTFGVVSPGGGAPIPPSGNIVVTATDTATKTQTSSCMAAAYQGAGMCTLSPAPTVTGTYSYAITYAGDSNFVASGFNGNYNVYQLAFTTQPSNTGVGLAINPAVVVTAQDFSNNNQPLTTFTGPVTVAIGSGTGSATATLSGTLTQNAVGGVATFGDLSINKIANGYKLTASPGGVADATSNPFNVDTFYVDANGNFGTLDLPSGTVTQIGAATVTNTNGIDLTPGGQVYAYNASNQLMQITPSTGAATPIGGPGSIPTGDQVTSGALTDGTYFAIDAVTGILYSINTASGATTSVGPTSSAMVPTGCTLDASLTGSASALYYTIGYSGASCTNPMSDTLYQIDPTSGTTTTIGPVTIGGSGVNAFVGSAFVGGTLYGFTADGKEYTIDTTATSTAGVATFLANTTPSVAIYAAGSSQ